MLRQAKELKRYKEAQKKQEKDETKRVEKATPKKEVKQKVATLKQDLESRRKELDQVFQQKLKEEYEKELLHLVQQQRSQMRDIEITYIQMEQDAKRSKPTKLMSWKFSVYGSLVLFAALLCLTPLPSFFFIFKRTLAK